MKSDSFVITILTMDGQKIVRTCRKPVYADTLAGEYRSRLPYDIYACRMDHHTQPLHTQITKDCLLELLDMRDVSAQRIYDSSLSFVYVTAIRDLFGPDTPVAFENGLGSGVYTTIRTAGITRDTDAAITRRMQEIIAADLPFERQVLDRQALIAYLEKNHLTDSLRLLNSAPDILSARLYTLAGQTEICFHELVPRTGYLKYFEVRRYRNGMLLRYPGIEDPETIPPMREEKNLYRAFAENTRWSRIAGVSSACALNEAVTAGTARDLVLISEALHEKRIAEIAATIRESGRRFVLIAGPSSSGKTTFARRLCIQLRVLGLRPLYLGTDDYFREREETPLGPDGMKDYESIGALDLDLFRAQMNDLLAGRAVDLPTFDFKSGKKIFGTRVTSVSARQPIVIEGIHGLNPVLAEGIDEKQKFRIYISPLTQLNIDDHNRISTNDARMLRRIVRDHQFRGNDAARTIETWPKVKAGEEKNIFPYTDQADIFFNSHLLYELCVLKKYAQPLLNAIPPDSPAYAESRRMLDFLDFFAVMSDDSSIPNNSIMREFIGGSVLV